jgi:hypothetical protein
MFLIFDSFSDLDFFWSLGVKIGFAPILWHLNWGHPFQFTLFQMILGDVCQTIQHELVEKKQYSGSI